MFRVHTGIRRGVFMDGLKVQLAAWLKELDASRRRLRLTCALDGSKPPAKAAGAAATPCPAAGKGDNQVRTRRRRVGSGVGADSAFGQMIDDRPLVHRPEEATPDSRWGDPSQQEI